MGWRLGLAMVVGLTVGPVTGAAARDLAGVTCASPPPLHCTTQGCPAGTLADLGSAVEPKSGRKFFLDYPCDVKPGEKVNLILSLHGGGSIGNWQRHYFPAMDLKEKYRLVIVTPTAATAEPLRMWTAAADDAYLENVMRLVTGAIGPQNVRSFWLAGHSQGGMTSNRIVCNDYFRPRIDGWLSLSGGRIGPAALSPSFGLGGGGRPAASPQAAEANFRSASGGTGARPGAAATPTCDMNYIFATGDHEIAGLPESSPWAERYGCATRVRRPDVVDDKPGWVTGQRPGEPNPAWGRAARPGTAQVFVYPKCKGGMLVADVMRLDKGHTEGLEPKVTEALIQMMLAAPGGRIRRTSAAD